MRYHVSADGVARECRAKTQETCRAVSSDGQPAPHAEFSSPDEARRFAERINASQYEPWDTTSRGGYFADGVGADEEAIAARSEAVMTGADLTIDEDEIDSEGRFSELSRDSTLRFVLDDDPKNSRPSGYQAWKVYGSEEDLAEFMDMGGSSEAFSYGERRGDWGESMPITIARAGGHALKDRQLSASGYDESFEVKDGSLVADGHNLGKLHEITADEVNDWTTTVWNENQNLEDGDVILTEDYDSQEPTAYARIGDKYYRAGGETRTGSEAVVSTEEALSIVAREHRRYSS